MCLLILGWRGGEEDYDGTQRHSQVKRRACTDRDRQAGIKRQPRLGDRQAVINRQPRLGDRQAETGREDRQEYKGVVTDQVQGDGSRN